MAVRVVPLLPETYYYYYYYYYYYNYCLSCVQSVLKFGDWFCAAWATDEEKEMVFAVKLSAHNNLATCSFRLGTHPHVQPSAPALPLPSALCAPGRGQAQPTLTLSPHAHPHPQPSAHPHPQPSARAPDATCSAPCDAMRCGAGNHQHAVVHSTCVLEQQPDNVKALYRRGACQVTTPSPPPLSLAAPYSPRTRIRTRTASCGCGYLRSRPTTLPSLPSPNPT